MKIPPAAATHLGGEVDGKATEYHITGFDDLCVEVFEVLIGSEALRGGPLDSAGMPCDEVGGHLDSRIALTRWRRAF